MKTVFSVLAMFVASATLASVPTSQRDALIAIYNASDGPSWTERSGWLGPPDTECAWYGVVCNEARTSVVEIVLVANNLGGTISPSIGNLPDLHTLLLYDNALTGSIPPSIGQLKRLDRVVLDRNALTGVIPSEIGGATQLRVFQAADNQLTGPLPATLGSLSALEELDLSANTITGALPTSLGQLTNLVLLRLDGNELSGPIPLSLGDLVKLQTLGLSRNGLTGEIPSEIGRLTSLRLLSLSENELEGEIAALTALTELEVLDLGTNRLTGTLPAEVGNLQKLQRLVLKANQLSGTLPPQLFTLTTLKEIDLAGNGFSGSIPSAIASLTNLETLTLNFNAFSGEIPRSIASLQNLLSFDVRSNDLTGEIPTEIGSLRELRNLDLAENEFTGPIPSSIGLLTNMRFLALSENQLSGSIPSELGNLTQLLVLYLTNNRLTGPIPDSLQNLKSLEAFWLGGNQLSGSLPQWIGDLTALTVIYFPNNEFTGSIPPSIGRLSNLTSLYLGANPLSGSIPREFGDLRQLGYLSLETTDIGGSIPIEFWNLTELVEVRLNDMALSGTLPPEVGNLKKAEVFLLSDNQLEGTIPPQIGDLESVIVLSLGQNRFTGTIPPEFGNLTKLIGFSLAFNALRGPVPSDVTRLTSVEDNSSDVGFNVLFAADEATRQFLNRKQYDNDFEASQTLTPANPRVIATTDRSATLEWNLIRYTSDEGGYQVTASPVSGGAPAVIATTSSKDLSQITVRNLESSTAYTFTVAAVTHPHDLQANLLVSNPSPSITATTLARTIAPADVVLTEATSGLVQIDGGAANSDQFTLTNFGDVATNIAFNKEPAFFTLTPDTFTLGAGASQTVIVGAAPQPAGSYYGSAQPVGPGAGDDAIASLTLLSIGRPSGTVVAEALETRIELAGAPGSDSVGAARFRNAGTSTLSGIVVSDQPWVIPSTDPITIAPGEVGSVNFRVVRSKRPSDVEGAITANLSLVYVDGSTQNLLRYGPLGATTPGVSVTLVQVIDTARLALTALGIPDYAPSEVAFFAPGITSLLRDARRLASDVSIVNAAGARTISDLRLFFTPVNTTQSTAASVNKLAAAQSLALSDIVANVYGVANGSGSLQFRTGSWQAIAARAGLSFVTPAGTFSGEVPVFRSDRSIIPGQELYLTGLRESATSHSDLYIQETGGAPGNVNVRYLDNAGATVATRDVTLAAFAMSELLDAVPAGAATAIVTNLGAGRIAAYARVTDDSTGDTWSIVDWSRLNRFTTTEAIRIPYVDGAPPPVGGGGRRRRAVSHAGRSTTDVTLFNPTPFDVRVRIQSIDASGRSNERDTVVGPRQTTVIPDIGSGSFSPVAQTVITPRGMLSRGDIIATARSSSGSGTGTAVPVLAASAGLRVGQSERFSNLEDSTSIRTSFGLVETSGSAVTVRARLTLSEGRTLLAAILFRDFPLAAGQQIFVSDLVRGILGPGRDRLGELQNVQVQFEVVQGNGSVVPFVLITDNGTGDTTLRLE